MERVVTLATSDVIQLDDLPPAVRKDYAAALAPSVSRDETLRTWASRYARLVLDRCRGNKREASQALGISYHTLQAYLRHPVAAATETRAEASERVDEIETLETTQGEPALTAGTGL